MASGTSTVNSPTESELNRTELETERYRRPCFFLFDNAVTLCLLQCHKVTR